MSERKAKMKNQGGFFFVCGSLRVYFIEYNLVACKPAFLHHLWGKQNYQALFVIVQTSDRDYVIFASFYL